MIFFSNHSCDRPAVTRDSRASKVNSTYKKHLRAVRRELFAVERLHLKPLHQSLVDIEGYVAVNSNIPPRPAAGGRLEGGPDFRIISTDGASMKILHQHQVLSPTVELRI